MNIENIQSHSELLSRLDKNKKSYLLLYKKGSEQSDCAIENYTMASGKVEGIQLFMSDVSVVRDIHEKYNVSSAPTLIEFEGTEVKNTIKGCHQSSYFKTIFEDAVYVTNTNTEGKPQKRVVVYSTPTCTWCNTIKSYFRENKIKFTDIDVSVNQAAAQAMVKKSGQQGVPQTEINGQMVVGFDKKKINTLLGING
ncbi:MAG: hypothetical protein K9H49_12980 [Bacteroidales bacterium]|nr:hypothetical protein [Bacteroidales bacterium]MCF8390397.1 hypothetical protein [Bacteroidales bacterium]